MPWCPECRTEYDEGFDTCADCHVPLVEEPPKAALALDLGEPVLLQTMDAIEAEILLAVLQDQQIPAYKKSCGAGDYMSIFGTSYLSVQIYVPRQLLKEAQEIAQALQPPEIEEEMPAKDMVLPEIAEDDGEDFDY